MTDVSNKLTPQEIDAELAANPLLHLIYATKRLKDAARDVLQYSDEDGELMAELAAALEEMDGVDKQLDDEIAASRC